MLLKQKFNSLLIFISCLSVSFIAENIETSEQNKSIKIKPIKPKTDSRIIRKLGINFKLRQLDKEVYKEIYINASEMAFCLLSKYGIQTYSLMKDDKTFEEAIRDTYRKIKANKISSSLIDAYSQEEAFASIKDSWDFCRFFNKTKRLSELLKEEIKLTEDEEVSLEKDILNSEETRIYGLYAVVNSEEDANNIRNSANNADNTDSEKRRQEFNRIASKFTKVKPLSDSSEKNYITAKEVVAIFGPEFSKLYKLPQGECSKPIQKNQNYFVFFIDNNEKFKLSKEKIKQNAIMKKISRLIDKYKKKNSIQINRPNELLNDNHVICKIGDRQITVLQLVRFLEMRIPGKNIRKLVSSMTKNQADSFLDAAISFLVDLVIQGEIAKKIGINEDHSLIPEAEIDIYLNKIIRIILPEDDLRKKYEELKDDPIFNSRIKFNYIATESQQVTNSIISSMQQLKQDSPNSLKEAFLELKKRYSIDSAQAKDSSKFEFNKLFPNIKESLNNEQKVEFGSILDGKVYVSGENYYTVILVDSVYTKVPSYDELKSEVISRLQKEEIISMIREVELKKLDLEEKDEAN